MRSRCSAGSLAAARSTAACAARRVAGVDGPGDVSPPSRSRVESSENRRLSSCSGFKSLEPRTKSHDRAWRMDDELLLVRGSRDGSFANRSHCAGHAAQRRSCTRGVMREVTSGRMVGPAR